MYGSRYEAIIVTPNLHLAGTYAWGRVVAMNRIPALSGVNCKIVIADMKECGRMQKNAEEEGRRRKKKEE